MYVKKISTNALELTVPDVFTRIRNDGTFGNTLAEVSAMGLCTQRVLNWSKQTLTQQVNSVYSFCQCPPVSAQANKS